MGLASGSTIAHYEILTPLGKGGMGEVYRARDTKLKREVAVKIVPDDFAADPQRLQRFQREAELLASLNHPNIAAIYGIEEEKSTQALILELVEGETLADRLRRGPLALDETLEIAKQIARALEAAHERGVIHRDLKPANIMLTRDGKTKVLDFGLATISQAAPASGDFSNSPTVFSVSGAGVLMGTAAYMSPEQARGKAVDRRSDVWAFGCVLFEMLTGRQLFGGETVSDSIAKVLEREPNWNELLKAPTRLRMLLRRCLEKNAGRRLRDLGDVLIELEDIRADDIVEPSVRKFGWIWIAATGIFAALSLVLGGLLLRTAPEPTEPTHLSITAPDGSALALSAGVAAPVLSPDGRFIAFITAADESTNGPRRLWIRPLNSADPRLVEESDGAAAPFWSPDSRWVGFFANRKMYRVDVHGGKPEAIASLDLSGGRTSATWNRDGTIVFALDMGWPLSRVSAEGGPVTAVTALDKARGDAGHFRPSFLPDGVHFLFLVQVGPSFGPGSGLYAGSLESKEIKPVLPGVVTLAYYVPSGHLFFVRDSAIFAQDFDPGRLELRNRPIRIADSVLVNRGNAAFAAFSVSETGILAYRTGAPSGAPSQLTWFDRKGTRLQTVGTIGQNRNPRLSPDGSQIAVSLGEPTGSAIWLLGPRAISSRFTAPAVFPVWSPDGNHLLYSGRNGTSNVLKKSVSVDAQEVLIQPSPGGHFDDISPDGRFLVISSVAGSSNRDVIAVSLDDQQKRIPIATTAANELYGRIYPDGRWVAYTSEESGHTEVYLQTFPVAGSRMLISRGGGSWPVWRRDGKELFYISSDRRKLMSVSISGSETLQPGTPQALFDINITSNGGLGTPSHYDVTADGQRFLIATAVGEETEISPIHIILNWPALLKR